MVLGSSTVAYEAHKWAFVNAADDCLRRMMCGPQVFVSLSRNMFSWILFNCPDPKFGGRPSWASWKGAKRPWDPNSEGTVLASFPAPTDVEEHSFDKFGFTHYFLLIPNPCRMGERISILERDAVAKLRKLCWGA